LKSKVWLDRNYRGDTVEIIVRDASRAKLGSWVISVNHKKRARQIMKQLKFSYGIDFGLNGEDDLSWLKDN